MPLTLKLGLVLAATWLGVYIVQKARASRGATPEESFRAEFRRIKEERLKAEQECRK